MPIRSDSTCASAAPTGPWRTIVGIVGDVRHQELAAPPTCRCTRRGAGHRFVPDGGHPIGRRPTVLAAGRGETIWSIAGDVPVYQVSPLADLVAKSVAPRRFVMVLLEIFGAVALLMTAIGVYGVISYAVAERTREIGIRAALGATSRDIVRLIVGGGVGRVGGTRRRCSALARRDTFSGRIALRCQRHQSGDVRRCHRRAVPRDARGASRDAHRPVGGSATGLNTTINAEDARARRKPFSGGLLRDCV